MITPNCFIDSQLPTNRNPFPISRQSIADWALNFRDSCRRQVTDWSATEKNAVLIAQWLHWLQLFFSRKAVTYRSQYMCDWGLNKSAHNIHVSFTLDISTDPCATHKFVWIYLNTTRQPGTSQFTFLWPQWPCSHDCYKIGSLAPSPAQHCLQPRKVPTILPSWRNNLLLALLCARDVETNPGPRQADIFPCRDCQDHVSWTQQAICCDGCNIWFHRSCQSMSQSHYHVIGNTDTQWKCCRCNLQLSNTFHSHELHNINVNVDSKLAGTSHPHRAAPRSRDSGRSRMSSQESKSYRWSSALYCSTHHRVPCQQQTISLHNVPLS